MRRAAASILLLACAATCTGGCFLIKKPDKANIELRKQNQQLQARIEELERDAKASGARILGLEQRVGTLPTLPNERLERLFTTHDIKLGRLTGGADLDPSRPGQEGLRIYVTPTDQTGDDIKAAGTFTVRAFDVSCQERPKIGEWTFDLEASRKHWSSVLNRYNYVLPCPWQDVKPAATSLHVEVTYLDELTQGKFVKTVDVTIEPPAAAPPRVE